MNGSVLRTKRVSERSPVEAQRAESSGYRPAVPSSPHYAFVPFRVRLAVDLPPTASDMDMERAGIAGSSREASEIANQTDAERTSAEVVGSAAGLSNRERAIGAAFFVARRRTGDSAFARDATRRRAIGVRRAGTSGSARCAGSSTIDARFATIPDAVVAGRRLADGRDARPLHTIASRSAVRPVRAGIARRSAAIDVRFGRILDSVAARGGGALFIHASRRRAVRTDRALLSALAARARAPAVDVRLGAVLRGVRATRGRRLACRTRFHVARGASDTAPLPEARRTAVCGGRTWGAGGVSAAVLRQCIHAETGTLLLGSGTGRPVGSRRTAGRAFAGRAAARITGAVRSAPGACRPSCRGGGGSLLSRPIAEEHIVRVAVQGGTGGALQHSYYQSSPAHDLLAYAPGAKGLPMDLSRSVGRDVQRGASAISSQVESYVARVTAQRLSGARKSPGKLYDRFRAGVYGPRGLHMWSVRTAMR